MAARVRSFTAGKCWMGLLQGSRQSLTVTGMFGFQSGNWSRCEVEHEGSIFSFLHGPAQFLCHLNTEVRGLGLELVHKSPGIGLLDA